MPATKSDEKKLDVAHEENSTAAQEALAKV